MSKLVDLLLDNDAFFEHHYQTLKTSLDRRVALHTFKGIIRTAFLIELVKSRGGSTKYTLRWDPYLREMDDPRYASYEQCIEIFRRLVNDLQQAWNNPSNRHLLKLFQTHSRISYEVPIDYKSPKIEALIHQADNIA